MIHGIAIVALQSTTNPDISYPEIERLLGELPKPASIDRNENGKHNDGREHAFFVLWYRSREERNEVLEALSKAHRDGKYDFASWFTPEASDDYLDIEPDGNWSHEACAWQKDD